MFSQFRLGEDYVYSMFDSGTSFGAGAMIVQAKRGRVRGLEP